MKYFQLVSDKKGLLSVALLSCGIFAASFETTVLNAAAPAQHTMSPALRRFCERLLLFLQKKYPHGWKQFCQESINDAMEDNPVKNAGLINCLRSIMSQDNKSLAGAKAIGDCLEKHDFYNRLPAEYKNRIPKLNKGQALALLRGMPQ